MRVLCHRRKHAALFRVKPARKFPRFSIIMPSRFVSLLVLSLTMCDCFVPRADAQAPSAPAAGTALAVPTFHCIGLYWSPPGGAADRAVQVRYRVKGSAAWSEGLPMRYNPVAGTEEDLTDYRGSIVRLQPGTTYEVALKLDGSSTVTTLTASTWREDFPLGQVTRVPGGDQTLKITESGKPDAWRVYDGGGATIDVGHKQNACITVNASHVILRNFVHKGAGATDNLEDKPIGAIDVQSGHDIVIEGCDISDWGRLNPKTGYGFNHDSAVLGASSGLARVVVQRCRLHHPAVDANTWQEPKPKTHPRGTHAVAFFNTDGNHVVRYNECVTDAEHMFHDVIGGGTNGSYRGSPGADSDIYGNIATLAWDDGMEVEGGGRNVRVWDNYISGATNLIANAAVSIGPLYVWGNVAGRCQLTPELPGYGFMKMGSSGGAKWQTGHQYIFHNTIFAEEGWLPAGGLGGSRLVTHATSRNNIFHIRSENGGSISDNPKNIDNDFDYNLFNGKVPAEHEAHGVRGAPVYADGAGFDAQTSSGRFQLAPSSPGVEAAQAIPNFTPPFTGKAPDIGAHQRGEPPLVFGLKAGVR